MTSSLGTPAILLIVWSIDDTPDGDRLSHEHTVPADLLPSLRGEPLGARRMGSMGTTRGDWARMRAARFMVDKQRERLAEAEDRLAVVVYELYWEGGNLAWIAEALGMRVGAVKSMAMRGADIMAGGGMS